MATTKGNFIPEIWSSSTLEIYKRELSDAIRPKRSKGCQLLRDAALGHKEYPEPASQGVMPHMTATEVNVRMTYANRASEAILRDLNNYVLDALKYSMVKGNKMRIVSS